MFLQPDFDEGGHGLSRRSFRDSPNRLRANQRSPRCEPGKQGEVRKMTPTLDEASILSAVDVNAARRGCCESRLTFRSVDLPQPDGPIAAVVSLKGQIGSLRGDCLAVRITEDNRESGDGHETTAGLLGCSGSRP